MKVLFVSSEVAPYSKSGGLGDVAGAMPKELRKLYPDIDIRIVTPKYGNISGERLKSVKFLKSFETNLGWRRQTANIFETDTPVKTYLIGNDYYFGRDGYYGYGDDYERFAFFAKVAVEMAGVIDFQPDIIHLNDWQTGLSPVYLKDRLKRFVFFERTKTLYTIHNLQFQGVYGRDVLSNIDLNDGYFTGGSLEFHGNINYMKAGLAYADAISTVSETYAHEIQTPMFGYGMDGMLRSRSNSLYGITNGIDYDLNNPATDSLIFQNYTVQDALEGKIKNKLALQTTLNLPSRPDVPFFAIVSRLTDQKGLDIMAIMLDEMLSKDLQLMVLGQGDSRYEQLLHHFCAKYPGRCASFIGFNAALAQKIYAASDFFMMPSLFEPCGLGQLIAMRYGALPVVRKTGGLADTVKHYYDDPSIGNGIVFNDYLADALMWAVNEALRCYGSRADFKRAVQNAMSADYSWKNSAGKYAELYEKLCDA